MCLFGIGSFVGDMATEWSVCACVCVCLCRGGGRSNMASMADWISYLGRWLGAFYDADGEDLPPSNRTLGLSRAGGEGYIAAITLPGYPIY